MTERQEHILRAMIDARRGMERVAIQAVLKERAELLAACESVMRWFADDNPTHSTIAIVRAAVARAKGGAL